MASTTKLFSLIIIGIIGLSLSSCDQNKPDDSLIPYDKEKAKEHIRPLAYAAALTADFKKGKIELARQLKDSSYLEEKFNLPTAEFFNRDAIAALLNQKDVKGIRIYLGKDRDTIKMVLVGVDTEGNDVTGKLTTKNEKMNYVSGGKSSAPAVIVEAGQRCPTMCPKDSPLYR